MDLRQLSPCYYVSTQIEPDDMAAIKAAGITHVLCNRPDAEVPPSHSADVMRAAAEAAGLTFAEQALTHQSMIPEVITQNRAMGVETGQVTLAYCASGTRSCIAWALGQAGTMNAAEIMQAAAEAGYDLGNIAPALDRPFT